MNKPTVPGPAYRIETDRLVIRCWEPKDAPLLNQAIRESWGHLGPWMPWAQGSPPPVADTAAMLRRWRGEFDLDQDFVYGIFSRDEGRVLGGTGLHTRRGEDVREIGYWIHADHIRKGYATETASALTKVAFEVTHVRRIEIHCVTRNVASASVPQKLGYTHDATLRRRLSVSEGTWEDEMIWSLFEDDYPDSPAAAIELRAYNAWGECILG